MPGPSLWRKSFHIFVSSDVRDKRIGFIPKCSRSKPSKSDRSRSCLDFEMNIYATNIVPGLLASWRSVHPIALSSAWANESCGTLHSYLVAQSFLRSATSRASHRHGRFSHLLLLYMDANNIIGLHGDRCRSDFLVLSFRISAIVASRILICMNANATIDFLTALLTSMLLSKLYISCMNTNITSRRFHCKMSRTIIILLVITFSNKYNANIYLEIFPR